MATTTDALQVVIDDDDDGRAVRILFVSGEHAATKGTGGVGSYVATITKALALRGHDVHVLSCVDDAAPADSVVDGVHLHTRPTVRIRGLARIVRGWMSRQALSLALSNYVHARRLGRFDIVEAPDWRAEGLLFAVLTRTPLVVHLHTPTHVLRAYNDEAPDRDSRLVSWLERTAARRATSVTCPARLLVAELSAQGWLNRDVEIIRYPVDWARFRDGAPPDGSSRVLFVGRLERRKAPERLLHALARLGESGIRGSAVFVGRGSGVRDGLNYGDWVRRVAAELGVDCTFVGEAHWADIPRLYEDAHVVCVPSEFESFSMTAVEGMAAARPVVVTDRVGAAELFATEEAHGQVCRANDHDLAAALASFVRSPDAAAMVGATNRALVIASCDPAVIAEQRESLFRRLVA